MEPAALIAVGLVVAILLFIALREFALWYFRLNEMADTLKAISAKLGPDVVDTQVDEVEP